MADELKTDGEHHKFGRLQTPATISSFTRPETRIPVSFLLATMSRVSSKGRLCVSPQKTTTRTRRKSCASTARASDAIKELQRGTTSETSIRRNRDTAIFLPLPSKLLDSSPCRCGADVIRCVRPTLVRARWYQSNRPQAGNANGVPGDRLLSRKLGERVVLWVRHEPANPA